MNMTYSPDIMNMTYSPDFDMTNWARSGVLASGPNGPEAIYCDGGHWCRNCAEEVVLFRLGYGPDYRKVMKEITLF